jgi:hypothetical protein
MRDRGPILVGLALGLGLFTWPAWRTLATPPLPPPQLARPTAATACVAPTEFMRASHMVLLKDWQDAAVRTGTRTFTTADGRVFPMSLTGTCLRACHTDKSKFCDRCHDYAHVAPTCWNCHVSDSAPLDSPRALGTAQPAADSRQPTPPAAVSMVTRELPAVEPLPAGGGVR